MKPEPVVDNSPEAMALVADMERIQNLFDDVILPDEVQRSLRRKCTRYIKAAKILAGPRAGRATIEDLAQRLLSVPVRRSRSDRA